MFCAVDNDSNDKYAEMVIDLLKEICFKNEDNGK